VVVIWKRTYTQVQEILYHGKQILHTGVQMVTQMCPNGFGYGGVVDYGRKILVPRCSRILLTSKNPRLSCALMVPVLPCCFDDGRIERKNDFHSFWLIVYPTYSINGNPLHKLNFFLVCCQMSPWQAPFLVLKRRWIARGCPDWVFPALTARGKLPHIIPCMLIDVCATFRVDWYVFPLLSSVERSSCIMSALLLNFLLWLRCALPCVESNIESSESKDGENH
jgi:hypothetical protein